MTQENRKVDLDNLRRACQNMIKLIDEIQNPETCSSGALGAFRVIADQITRELE